MVLNSRPYTFDRFIRLLIGMALLWGLVWLLNYLSDALIPFTVALLLAYMINPLVNWVQKMVRNRISAVLLSLLILLLIFAGVMMAIIPLMVMEVAHMGQLLSRMVNDTELARRASELLPADIWQTIKGYAARPEIQSVFKTSNFWKIVEAAAQKVLPGVWGLIAGTASLVMGLIGLGVIGLYLVFLLLDYEKVRLGWPELLPHAYREPAVAFLDDFESAMSRYFRGQALVAFICGVLFAVGFAIIGLPLGILLGLFFGMLNMVPYLQIVGFIPAVFLALVHALETGAGVWGVLAMTLAVFFVVQIIQDTLLVPRIMGKVTGLNPAMIMLSLSVWSKLLGFLGLIIALPMTYLVLVYYRRYLALAQAAQNAPPPPPPPR